MFAKEQDKFTLPFLLLDIYGSAIKGKRLKGHQLMLEVVATISKCFVKCMITQGCVSLNVYNDPFPTRFHCEMKQALASEHAQDFLDDITSTYYEFNHCA